MSTLVLSWVLGGAVVTVLALLIVAGVPPVTVVVASLLGLPLAVIYARAGR